MPIIVRGSIAPVGSHVVRELAARNANVRALAHKTKSNFPSSVTPAKVDVTDVESMRKALVGTDTLFLVNPVVANEINHAFGYTSLKE
jgi:uncharacterized protein YbjT (DUF2867 family)